MKKVIYLSAIAAVALAGCTNDDSIVSNTESGINASDGISFKMTANKLTRADHVGADAAALLNKKFVVGGFKGAKSTNGLVSGEVFDDYIVKWGSNTAGTTESNTSDWEYVGETAVAPSSVAGAKQGIKYWDYSSGQYDFIAYSTGTAEVITEGTPTAGQVLVSPITASKAGAYTLRGSAADLAKCYISDLYTAYHTAETDKPKFMDEVNLKFRNLAAKVRLGFYETIPGYSVKNVKFYTDGTTEITTCPTETSASLYTSGSGGSDKFYLAGTATVSFPTVGTDNLGNSDYNKAHVRITPETTGGTTTSMSFGDLTYGTKEDHEPTDGIWLGRNSTAASYSNNKEYTAVLPNETGTSLTLRVDYTLEATDGTGEEITVHGATAVVPSIYAQWKSNYAYTYIFKISDNTGGWTSTSTSDPSGIYPITFDAVAIDAVDGVQETVTTVATPSITTYSPGVQPTVKNEYIGGKDIYVMVQKDAVLKGDLSTKGQLYTVTTNTGAAPVSEATVHDALTIGATTAGTVTTGRNGIVLTEAESDATITAIPGADGNDITVTAGQAAKFTAATAATTYAYVYETTTGDPTTTYLYTSVSFASGADKPADFPSAYFKDNAGTAVADADWNTTNAQVFYQKVSNTNKTYAVKVIKVVAP